MQVDADAVLYREMLGAGMIKDMLTVMLILKVQPLEQVDA